MHCLLGNVGLRCPCASMCAMLCRGAVCVAPWGRAPAAMTRGHTWCWHQCGIPQSCRHGSWQTLCYRDRDGDGDGDGVPHGGSLAAGEGGAGESPCAVCRQWGGAGGKGGGHCTPAPVPYAQPCAVTTPEPTAPKLHAAPPACSPAPQSCALVCILHPAPASCTPSLYPHPASPHPHVVFCTPSLTPRSPVPCPGPHLAPPACILHPQLAPPPFPSRPPLCKQHQGEVEAPSTHHLPRRPPPHAPCTAAPAALGAPSPPAAAPCRRRPRGREERAGL